MTKYCCSAQITRVDEKRKESNTHKCFPVLVRRRVSMVDYQVLLFSMRLLLYIREKVPFFSGVQYGNTQVTLKIEAGTRFFSARNHSG